MKTLLMLFSLAIILAGNVKSQCTYRVDLYDSFGDGWQGGLLTVKVNGVDVITGLTVASGAGPVSQDFVVNTGDVITTAYTAGSWPEENEYYVFDAGGTEIFSDGVGGTTPATSANVGTANCSGCYSPSGLSVSGIGDTYAVLNWTELASATVWNIEWGVFGFTLGSGTLISETTTKPYPITGLSASTQYQFYVQSVCGPTETSTWTGPFSFYTSACAVSSQCVFDLNMTDAGNSWNGANISVFQDGVLLGTYTVSGGGANYDHVTLCNGSDIELVWSSGSYDNECIFSLADPYGTVLYSFPQGGAPSAGLFFSFSSDCVPPLCPAPTSANAFSITDVSAQLGWTEMGGANTWNIEYGAQGFTQGTGVTINGTNSNPYSLTGLIPGLSYSFYVQSDCGVDGTSSWVGPINFTMGNPPLSNPSDCELGYAIPDGACEDFVINVNGIGGTELGIDSYVKEVRIIIQHTFDVDLIFSLTSPNGVNVLLSEQHGGGGDNYGIIDGTCSQYTSFKMDAAISIGAGSPPFVGEFLPEGNLENFNDNSNPNGYWNLQVCDQMMSDLGSLQFVEIVFGTFGTEAEIIAYSFPEQTGSALIDTFAKTVDIEVDWQADLSSLRADFELSVGASASVSGTSQISGLTINDFSNPVIYSVTAEDGVTTNLWTVNVTKAEMPQGAVCSWPLPISLPVYGESGTTEGFGDDYNNSMTCSSNFMNGDDIVYEFTIPVNGTLSGSLSASINWIGIFITDGCPDDGGTCVINKTSTGSVATFTDMPIVAGTYFLIISNYAPPQSMDFSYDLVFTPDPSTIDLGIAFPTEDIESCSFSTEENISICLINAGGTTLLVGDSIPVGYNVDGGTNILDTIVLENNLPYGDSVCYVFPDLFDFSSIGNYEVNLWLNYEGDLFVTNNSFSINYVNYFPNAEFVGGDTLFASSFPYTIELVDEYSDYYWYNSDFTQTSDTVYFEVDSSDWYYVDLTDENGCFFTDSVFVDVNVSVGNFNNEQYLKVFPNPNKGEFNLVFGFPFESTAHLTMTDVCGRIILQKAYKHNKRIFDTFDKSDLNPGVYLITLQANNKNFVARIIVE